MARLLGGAKTSFWQTVQKNKANLRGTQCLVALKRWQLEHAEPPPDIETLVKAAGMPGVPTDPYSGEPYRLASVAGKQVIYSVGPDGKDNQAQIEWTPYLPDPGDYTFRLDAANEPKK